jgi:transposase
MISEAQLSSLEPQTRSAVQSMLELLSFKQALIDKLTHEVATLRRLKDVASSERFAASLSPEQKSLLEETLDADLAEVSQEIKSLGLDADEPQAVPQAKNKPRRQKLPAHLPRTDVLHEPHSTLCGCGCQMQRVGEDVAEKLDYTPGVFTVQRHVRGKWACRHCEKLVQAPVPAHVIDKGIPTAGLLAQVLVAKYADDLPLCRQEAIFERAGLAIPRSTLAAWVGQCGAQLQPLLQALGDELRRHTVLHADETPVAMLKPASQRDGKTQRAYVWSYSTPSSYPVKAVVFEFSDTRSGENVRRFLKAVAEIDRVGAGVELAADGSGGRRLLDGSGHGALQEDRGAENAFRTAPTQALTLE